MKKKIIYIFVPVFIIFISLFIFGHMPEKVWASVQRTYNKWMILTMILDKVERYYVDELNPDVLLDNAINGMLSSLDPHSIYLNPDSYELYSQNYSGYSGIGLKYNIIGNSFVVVSIAENGPADVAGICIGDRIKKIDGYEITDLKIDQIKELFEGPANRTVLLVVERPNQTELLEFYLPIRRIVEESIPAAFKIDKITGYIKINHFAHSTPVELDLAFAELRENGMEQLILDLRNNSGGDLYAGVSVADRFIPGGKMIVFTKGRTLQSNEQFISTSKASLPIIPLVVLVNEATASDAEIVAGAIQDWDRGVIVGRRTFGKALVQTEFPFQDGSALLLTTARYYTPLGRLIQNDYYYNFDKSNQIEQSNVPLKYKTPKGRQVYGGGGILPDFEISKPKADISDVLKLIYLAKENCLFKFADQFVSNLSENEWINNKELFLENFNVTNIMLDQFYSSLANYRITITHSDFYYNADEIKHALKREIAGRLWGESGRQMVTVFTDPEILMCSKYMKNAKDLL